MCAFFPSTVVLRLGIMLGWLMYLVVCLNDAISGRLVNTCSVEYNNCKCCIDTCLNIPALSCTSNALSEIFIQIHNWVYILNQMHLLGYGSLLESCLLF